MLGQTVFSLDFFMLIGKDTQSRPPTLRGDVKVISTRIFPEFQAAELRKSKLTLKLQHANEADSDNASTKEQNQDLCSGRKIGGGEQRQHQD